MNITDLMIGDYVQVKTYTLDDNFQRKEFYTTVKVVELAHHVTIERLSSNESFIICEISELRPISLTREILLENGFVKVDFSHYATKDRNIILDADDSWNKWNWVVQDDEGYDCYVCTIDSVHELQHIMKQCKINESLLLK